MEYFYSHARLPKNPKLLIQINQAAARVKQKLLSLDLENIGVSEYNQRYLGGYLQNIRGILQINTFLLAWALADVQHPIEDIVFVDYGGGPGILTFLAVEMGIVTVIYNDIYDVSCQDAEKIGKAIGNSAHSYVEGDIDVLIAYLVHHDLQVDAIASYDVIEHIYNTEQYFRQLKQIPHHKLHVAFASSANMHNPLVRRARVKGHHTAELSDRDTDWGYKERDTLRSYLSIREEIIAQAAPTLPAATINQLAHDTRGLIKKDIEQAVAEYLKSGKISYIPDHTSNTCDPLTGNWCERLMDTRWICKIFESEEFTVEIKSGYYAYTPKRIVQLMKAALNLFITFTGAKNLTLSSYYLIYAEIDQ